jgi:hypothetical protein
MRLGEGMAFITSSTYLEKLLITSFEHMPNLIAPPWRVTTEPGLVQDMLRIAQEFIAALAV